MPSPPKQAHNTCLNKPVESEIELAYCLEQASNNPRPMVAITGTDGKTTTTLLAAAMINSAGV
ncbi:MAG: UDP-N-acetylmuramoyl-L-alanine--D-glutamate ligase, partial [Actinomycetota bacterium]